MWLFPHMTKVMGLHSHNFMMKQELPKDIAPCMNCSDRFVGCHSKCERYKAYRKMIDERKKQKMKHKGTAFDVYKSTVRRYY